MYQYYNPRHHRSVDVCSLIAVFGWLTKTFSAHANHNSKIHPPRSFVSARNNTKDCVEGVTNRTVTCRTGQFNQRAHHSLNATNHHSPDLSGEESLPSTVPTLHPSKATKNVRRRPQRLPPPLPPPLVPPPPSLQPLHKPLNLHPKTRPRRVGNKMLFLPLLQRLGTSSRGVRSARHQQHGQYLQSSQSNPKSDHDCECSTEG